MCQILPVPGSLKRPLQISPQALKGRRMPIWGEIPAPKAVATIPGPRHAEAVLSTNAPGEGSASGFS
jgi:hypothetical protein